MRLVLDEEYASTGVIVMLFAVAYLPFLLSICAARGCQRCFRAHCRPSVRSIISVPLVVIGGLTRLPQISLVITYVIINDLFVRAGYLKRLGYTCWILKHWLVFPQMNMALWVQLRHTRRD